jgi:hypothetical protein
MGADPVQIYKLMWASRFLELIINAKFGLNTMADTTKKKVITDSQVLRRNLVITFVLMFILLLMYIGTPGYYFAIKEVAIGNKQRIDQIETRRLNFNLPELRLEDKLLFRIEDYWYIQFMNTHTPDTAVILLPPLSAIDTTAEFNSLNDPEYMEYFLYPRLCVSEDQKDTKKDLYTRATHVAIVNGWGYDKLKYQPKEKPSEAVLPIQEPPLSQVKASSPFQKGDTTIQKNFNLNPQ